MRGACRAAALLLVLAGVPAGWTAGKAAPTGPSLAAGIQADAAVPGYDERLGASVPLDITLVDEQGAPVRLGDLVRTPTILALVYYRCRNSCDYLLTGLAAGLDGMDVSPGRDYQAITVSFDDREGPADALASKRIALESMQKPFPQDGWRFLTGTARELARLTDAVGFRYARNGAAFDHPLGIVVLSPGGKIVRYMGGTDFLPVDLRLALMEASTGTVRPTIAKVLRFCFSYDPRSRQFVFNTLKISAILVFALAGSLLAYLLVSGRRRRMAGKAGR